MAVFGVGWVPFIILRKQMGRLLYLTHDTNRTHRVLNESVQYGSKILSFCSECVSERIL